MNDQGLTPTTLSLCAPKNSNRSDTLARAGRIAVAASLLFFASVGIAQAGTIESADQASVEQASEQTVVVEEPMGNQSFDVPEPDFLGLKPHPNYCSDCITCSTRGACGVQGGGFLGVCAPGGGSWCPGTTSSQNVCYCY